MISLACLEFVRCLYGLYVAVNMRNALYCYLGVKIWLLQEGQWWDLLLSPKREWLAQARLVGADQGMHELSLRRRALVLSEPLSRSGERCSPKREGVEALGCHCSFSPGEEPQLWARSGLAQAREGSPKRVCENLPRPLSRSCLSESL